MTFQIKATVPIRSTLFIAKPGIMSVIKRLFVYTKKYVIIVKLEYRNIYYITQKIVLSTYLFLNLSKIDIVKLANLKH